MFLGIREAKCDDQRCQAVLITGALQRKNESNYPRRAALRFSF